MAGGKYYKVIVPKGHQKKTVKRYKKSSANVARLLTFPLPDKMIVKTRYCDYFTLTPGAAGVVGLQCFRANGIFDTDVTNVGHQVLGHDEFAIWYSRYAVISSKITVIAANNSAGAGQNIIVAIHVDDDNTVSANMGTLLEQAGTSRAVLGINGPGTVTVKNKWHYKVNAGYSDYLNSDNNNTLASDPPVQFYYNLGMAALDGASSPAAVPFTVKIEYVVCLYKRKDLVQS